MGILRDALLPERAARIRRDTGEVRDSFGSLGVTRVRSGALAVPIRGPRPAIVPPMGSGSEPRSSRRRVSLGALAGRHRLWALRLEHRLSVWIFFARADSGRFGVPQTVTP
jgi:hypothetical protein